MIFAIDGGLYINSNYITKIKHKCGKESKVYYFHIYYLPESEKNHTIYTIYENKHFSYKNIVKYLEDGKL